MLSFCGRIIFDDDDKINLLLLRSNAGMVVSDLEVNVFGELGSSFEVTPWKSPEVTLCGWRGYISLQ